jgi:predicted MFS family arabinose efflux permease
METPNWLVMLLATACGLIVANIYYVQPLAGPISEALGLSPQAAGLLVTMTQIGYGIGLLLIVPLADLIENRRVIVSLIALSSLALAGASLATSASVFFCAAACIGLSSVAVQVLVPYSAHMSSEASRGRVVGTVTGGLMFGIMLARPVSSFIAHALSWHAVFALSAALMVALAVLLRLSLPRHQPNSGVGYLALLVSLGGLARRTPILQRRALYQSCLFGSFSLFWTTSPLLLASVYHLTQNGIALFALAGVTGAISAPIAGRVADRGWGKPATVVGMIAVALSFLLSRAGTPGTHASLAMLLGAAILLDFGVTANLVLGQRAIFALGAAYRGRLNGLYLAALFVGGAFGSAVGGWAYAYDGWALASWVGLALPIIALASYATER